MNTVTDSSQAHLNKNKLYIHRDNGLSRNIQVYRMGGIFIGRGTVRDKTNVSKSEHSIGKLFLLKHIPPRLFEWGTIPRRGR